MTRAAEIFEVLARQLPTLRELLLGIPLSALWASAALYLAGRLKRDRGLPTGYTRKIFHFLIVIPAALVQVTWGLGVLCAFGAVTSLLVLLAVWQGEGALLYEAIAREKDAPRRTYFILVAYLATLLGGLLANLLFGGYAIAGYLVTGLADAVAEPVGTRFGRHVYRVPSFGGVAATRSLEGSTSVLLASVFALACVGLLAPELAAPWPRALPLLGIAALCTLVEAVSPHGWDNATLQLVPSWLLWQLGS